MIAVGVLVVTIGIGIWGYYKKHFNTGVLVAFCFVNIFNIIVSDSLVKNFPAEYDTIQIQATSQANPEAVGTEIGIKSFLLDGKEISLNYPTQGLWYLENGRLKWRSYDQAPNLTDTIILNVPAGKNRALMFEFNMWRGIADITYEGNTSSIDFFSPTHLDEFTSIPIPDTVNSKLVLSQVKYFAALVFVLIMLLMVEFIFIFRGYMGKKQGNMRTLAFETAGVILALAFLCFCIRYSTVSSLWDDDLAQIYYASPNQTWVEVMNKLILEETTNPPLSALFGYIWMHVVPFGTMWLKLPSILSVFLGALVCGKIAKSIESDFSGLLTVFFVCTSSFIIFKAGYTFRAYGPVFLFCALILWCYLKRLYCAKQESCISLTCYSIAILLAIYTHYFAILVVGALFISDIYLFAIKKIHWRCISSYIGAGVVFLPWFLMSLINSQRNYAVFWPPVPKFIDVYQLFNELCDARLLTKSAVIFGGVYIITSFMLSVRQKKNISLTEWYKVVITLTTIFVVGVVFIYSAYINSSRSVWVSRYFIVIMPMLLLVASLGISAVLNTLLSQMQVAQKSVLQISFFMVVFIPVLMYTIEDFETGRQNIYQPYEKAATWVYGQPESHLENALSVVTSNYALGWNYYLTQGETRTGINIAAQKELTESSILEYDYLFLTEMHRTLDPTLNIAIGENFQLLYEATEYNTRMYRKISNWRDENYV